MLISPLMGPILGIGLAIGINDIVTLKRSLINFGIAVAISLAASALYFYLTPLDVEQSEIASRKIPSILDVLIATFGGIAGIVAASRSEKSNVVPGVAIATALMPPLCVAGYGLANLDFDYFFGALYLFFINSVCICVATLAVVRYLKFPLLKYQDKDRMNQYYGLLTLFLLIAILPSSVLFSSMIRKTQFEHEITEFVNDEIDYPGNEVISHKVCYTDSMQFVDLYLLGDGLSGQQEDDLRDKFSKLSERSNNHYFKQHASSLRIRQQSDLTDLELQLRFDELNQKLRSTVFEKYFVRTDSLMTRYESRLSQLEKIVSIQDSIIQTHIDGGKKTQRR